MLKFTNGVLLAILLFISQTCMHANAAIENIHWSLNPMAVDTCDSFHEYYIKSCADFLRSQQIGLFQDPAATYMRSNISNVIDILMNTKTYDTPEDIASAKHILSLYCKTDTGKIAKEIYYYGMSNIMRASKEPEVALAYLDSALELHDFEGLSANNIILPVEKINFYNEKVASEKQRHKNLIILFSLGVIVILALCFFAIINIRKRYISKQNEVERQMVDVQSLINEASRAQQLAQKLDSISGRLEANKLLFHDLIRRRFDLLDKLCSEYFRSGDSGATVKNLITEFEDQIKVLKESDFMNELQSLINGCYDNILLRISEQMPKLKDKHIRFITLLLAGFSPRSICLLMDIKHGNYYNIWTRLRKSITESNAPDKREFLFFIEKQRQTNEI